MKINWSKGLIPAIIQHCTNHNVLMLGYMNEEAFNLTESKKNVYFFSRSKNRIWMKGEESGNRLEVQSIKIDCDNDTILIQAKPLGVTCHTGTDTCFGQFEKPFLDELEDIISQRMSSSNENSYIQKLVKSGLNKVAQKVGEEGVEVALAAVAEDDKLVDEASDLLFHLMVLLKVKGLSLDDIILNLQRRHKERRS